MHRLVDTVNIPQKTNGRKGPDIKPVIMVLGSLDSVQPRLFGGVAHRHERINIPVQAPGTARPAANMLSGGGS